MTDEQIYLDELEEREVILAGPFVREPFTPEGVPFDPERHPHTFDVKALKERGTEPPPLVLCRPATAAEIPGAAKSAARVAEAHGWQVKITYAQGGKWRRGVERGKCSCGSAPPLFVDTGLQQSHNTPTVVCDGTELLLSQFCTVCGRKVKMLKRGGLAKHDKPSVPCPITSPPEVIPGPPKPPVSSVVVRVQGCAAAAWVEGQFDGAYVVAGNRILPADSDTFGEAIRKQKSTITLF
jgi:hypothetical protein